MATPRAFVNKFVVIDCETSALNFDQSDPDITRDCQSLSWGVIISDLKTMKPIEELYVEIKWDGVSKWSTKAEQIHGMSKVYLEENALDEQNAAEEIAVFLSKHFDIDDNIVCMGHNVGRFDVPFFKKLLYKYDFPFKISHRSIDTSGMGMVFLEAYDSQQLFDALGIPRGDVHNALEDAKATLKAGRIMKLMFKKAIDG